MQIDLNCLFYTSLYTQKLTKTTYLYALSFFNQRADLYISTIHRGFEREFNR
jgi:hypothetical protein